jgi:hypothetical protein
MKTHHHLDIIEIIRMIIIQMTMCRGDWVGEDDGSRSVVNRFWSARALPPKIYLFKKKKTKKKPYDSSLLSGSKKKKKKKKSVHKNRPKKRITDTKISLVFFFCESYFLLPFLLSFLPS